MTGSGKTGLGIVLIEECLGAGVPCLLIDPKGDLTNLCLLFPDLAPADFRPWINDGDAQKAGVTPDEFAAPAGNAVEGRPGRLVDRRRAPAPPSATACDVHDLHAGLHVRASR